MIKQALVIFLLLCGLGGNAFAGTPALGSTFKSASYMTTTKPIWGISGYILLSPISICPSSGHGSSLYHTHSSAMEHGYETIVYYGANGDIRLKAFSWAVNNNYVNYLHPEDNTQLWQNAIYDTVISANGTWTAGVLKYLTNITMGAETKKAIFFENFSFFRQYAGTTTGKVSEFIRIKNFETQSMDYKWAQAWDGTLAEIGRTSDPAAIWAGALETFNTGTPFPSAPTVSVGNYGMTFFDQRGIPTLMNTTTHTFLSADIYDNTGLTVYNAGAHAGEWLGHAP